MKIRKIEFPFLPCKRSTMIECLEVNKNTAEEIALLLGYEVHNFYSDLDFILDGEIMGSWIEENSNLTLYIDEGSEAEIKFLSLGGEDWIKKALTSEINPV